MRGDGEYTEPRDGNHMNSQQHLPGIVVLQTIFKDFKKDGNVSFVL